MRRTIILIAAVLLLAIVPAGIAQQKKSFEFRVLYTMTLAFNMDTGEGGWMLDGDSPHAILNGEGVTPAITVGAVDSSFRGNMGQDRNGTYVFDLGEDNTFTVEEFHATYEYTPGQGGMVTYHGVGRITGGTGIFTGATGTYAESGPTILWPTVNAQNVPFLMGKYQASGAATIYVR